jgi:hypothetical protein
MSIPFRYWHRVRRSVFISLKICLNRMKNKQTHDYFSSYNTFRKEVEHLNKLYILGKNRYHMILLDPLEVHPNHNSLKFLYVCEQLPYPDQEMFHCNVDILPHGNPSFDIFIILIKKSVFGGC